MVCVVYVPIVAHLKYCVSTLFLSSEKMVTEVSVVRTLHEFSLGLTHSCVIEHILNTFVSIDIFEYTYTMERQLVYLSLQLGGITIDSAEQ